MVVEQGLVPRRVGQLGRREASSQGRGGQVMKGVPVDLGNPGSQVAPHDELVALKLGLDDNQGKIGLGVHVARHLLDLLNLLLDTLIYALEEALRLRRPAGSSGKGFLAEDVRNL